MGQAVSDMGAVISAPLVVIGEKLGLYKAMAGAGPLTPRSWPSGPAPPSATCASGCATRPPAATSPTTRSATRYTLPDEHALALADEDSPVYILGGFESIASLYADEDQILEAFRSGNGLGWDEHDPACSRAPSASSVPATRPPGRRVDSRARRRRGEARARREGRRRRLRARRLDDPHGEGLPELAFVGFDYHEASIERAREAAERGRRRRPRHLRGRDREGLPGHRLRPRVRLRLPARHGRPGRRRGARARDARRDGTWMIVEPFADDRSRTTSTRSGASSTAPRR